MRWQRGVDSIPEKSFTSDNIPGFNVARRALNFKRAIKHKQMMENYEAFRRKWNKPQPEEIGKEFESMVKEELAQVAKKKERKKIEIKDSEYTIKLRVILDFTVPSLVFPKDFNLWETIKSWAIFRHKDDGKKKPN